MRNLLIIMFCCVTTAVTAQRAREETEILRLVQQFFDGLAKQDTAGIRGLYIDGGRNYAVFETRDGVVVRTQDPSEVEFREGQILHERMRKATTSVKIEGRIAMAWVPYDLWVNDAFSHCGVDVFTFLKTDAGWKLATVAYTVETEGCG